MQLSVILSAVVSVLTAALVYADGPRTQCVETYRPTATDTCSSISAWSTVPVSTIQSMNPGMSCSAPMGASTVCLRKFLPTCTLNATAHETTCNDLATYFNLTQSQFVQLNDNVDNACDNLVIGAPYCVSIADCFPGNTNPLCTGHEGRK
ncbi:hypothetical protein K488DRAFT_81353 [Vararia minispora EC-137]|uniref:Uncharacterized protein n=1 Tax=Vararia minispora EC-137 TaxID=1314806 RepID=A0ACB8QZQ1_9AGAM|nr:hypothetical protein K488DRAFT_81353 [Vararia minispora EC-137]